MLLLFLINGLTLASADELTCAGVGDSAIITCHTLSDGNYNRWYRLPQYIFYTDSGSLNPSLDINLKSRLNLTRNKTNESWNLQITNVTVDDEGNYLCETQFQTNVKLHNVYLKVIDDYCRSYSECPKAGFNTSRCRNFETTSPTITYETAFSIWNIVIMLVLASFVTFLMALCVLKLRHRSKTISYNIESQSSRNNPEDVHEYQEINVMEIGINNGNQTFMSIQDYGSDNDEEDYLHPYCALLENHQLDNHKYEHLTTVSVHRPIRINRNQPCMQSDSRNSETVDGYKYSSHFQNHQLNNRKIKTKYTFARNRTAYTNRQLRYGQQRAKRHPRQPINYLDGSKSIFYSEPCNLNRCLVPYTLSESDITTREEIHKSLEIILNLVENRLVQEKHIDDNISLD